MAPKRRNKVVGSVVKTKVVQETVEVTSAIVADDDGLDQQAAAEELPASGNLSSVVRQVEVTTPDRDTSADVNVKQQPKRRGRGGSKAAVAQADDLGKKPPPEAPATNEEETPAPLLQIQEAQDPNEDEAAGEEDAGGKKRQRREADEEQPRTPRVASERKTTKVEEEQGAATDGSAEKRRHRRRRRRLGGVSPGGDAGMGGMGGYKRYVWRVLKQVHPEMGVSGRAMQVLDMMMADMFERLAGEAARLSKIAGRITLTSREVQTAVRLVLPGELGKHAISEGVKAISKYTAS